MLARKIVYDGRVTKPPKPNQDPRTAIKQGKLIKNSSKSKETSAK